MIDLILSLIPGGGLTAILAGAGALLLAFWRTYAAGKKAERNAQARQNLEAVRDRKEKDDEIESLGPADVDSRFDRWRMPDERR